MHSINAHKQQQSPPFVAQALDSFAQILSLARTHINHSSAENKNKFIVPQIKWEKRQKKKRKILRTKWKNQQAIFQTATKQSEYNQRARE